MLFLPLLQGQEPMGGMSLGQQFNIDMKQIDGRVGEMGLQNDGPAWWVAGSASQPLLLSLEVLMRGELVTVQGKVLKALMAYSY